EHLNKCLKKNGRALTDTAKEDLPDFIGEIITNAEDHSEQNRWYVCGYMDHDHQEDVGDDLESHHCEIVIYNFGRTIAETFTDLDQNSYAYQLVKPFVDHHSKSKLFSSNWSQEDLLTIASLQSHISSKQELDSTRGHGTIDLIEFFQQVSEE